MFLKAFLSWAAIYMLTACSTPPRDVKLAGLDLGQSAVLTELKRGLAPDERAALTLYAALHWRGSKHYCGHPAFAQAAEPRTIGEAIDRTIAFETSLSRKRMAEAQPASLSARRAQRDQELVDKLEEVTLRRSMLLSRVKGQANPEGELKSIDRQLESVKHQRSRLGNLQF